MEEFPVRDSVDWPSAGAARRMARPRKYPVDRMEVGKEFLVPNVTSKYMSSYVAHAGSLLGRKFSVRTVYMVQKDDIWEDVGEWCDGATRGVRVKRIK